MTLAELRDLFIVIVSLLMMVTLLVMITLAIVTFRKVVPILNSVQAVVDDIRGTSSFIAGTLAGPVSKGISFLSGLRAGLDVIMGLSKKKGATEHEQQQE